MKLRPVHDKIIVRRLLSEEKVGGIYFPEKVREKPTRGEVLAVGPGAFDPSRPSTRVYSSEAPGFVDTPALLPMCCKPGDVIVFGKYAGTETDDILIISDGDVLAVEEKP